MDILPVQHHIYIKHNDTVAEQREGLNRLLMMSQQTKAGHQQIVITPNVMNIADFLLIFHLNEMPPSYLMAQALAQYQCQGDDISPGDVGQIIASLSRDSFNDQSPAKSSPARSNSRTTAKNFSQREAASDSGSDSDDKDSRSNRSVEVTLKQSRTAEYELLHRHSAVLTHQE